MKINKIFTAMMVLGLTVAVSACSSSSSKSTTPTATGFLPNYSLLQQVPNTPPGITVYTYKNPAVKRGDYTAVIVAPVALYQTATQNGITQDQIETARQNIQDGVKQIVSQNIPITNTPGPGVAMLNVAITGASVEGQALSARNLIPISAAITLATKATNTDNKTAVMVVELKFTDSVTGNLLRETVTTVNSEQFRNQANTAQEFTQLAQQWVQQALQYSSQQNKL